MRRALYAFLLLALTAFTISCSESGEETKAKKESTGKDETELRKKMLTSFFKAVEDGNTEKVRELIEGSVDVNASLKRPYYESAVSPLFAAAKHGHYETAKLLLERGAKIKKHSYPAHAAAKTENAHKLLPLLFEHGVDKNAIDRNGDTLFTIVMGKEDFELAKYLLESGVKVKDEYVFLAVGKRRPEIVLLLIEKGADIYIEDPYGQTPLEYAQEEGFEDIVEILSSSI